MGSSTLTAQQRVRKPVRQRTAIHFKNRGASLGLSATSVSALIEQIEEGFAFEALDRLESHTGLSVSELGAIVGIPERTLARRKAAGKLEPEESERLLRMACIFEKATELFDGDIASAMEWLTTPKIALNGKQPLLYSKTELGAREVENLIGRLEHGVFS